MTDLCYIIEDAEGFVLSGDTTESFWEACKEAKTLAVKLQKTVWIVSDDPEDRPFKVEYTPGMRIPFAVAYRTLESRV